MSEGTDNIERLQPLSDRNDSREVNLSSEGESFTFQVGEAEAGERLDAFLAMHIEGWSRSRLQRLIEDGDVLVGGRKVKAAYKLKALEEIDVDLVATPPGSFGPEDIPIDVIYEDDDLIVVNKPAGLVVHPAAGNPSGTLANALAYHFERLSSRAGSIRPGIVHRLDKGTSGLMVVAKTEAAHENLSDQFRARSVRKSYVALVHGVTTRESGKIDQPIARDPRNRTRMAVVSGGRTALSIFRVRTRFHQFTLLDVELKTGRTHQIRVHLSWLKHPVVGDDLYGGGRDNMVKDPRLRSEIRKLNRQFLHAERLGFSHPVTDKPMEFEMLLPNELRQLLTLVESSD